MFFSLDQKGFTLIEVLVSFTILAIGLTVMLGLQLSSLKVDYKNLALEDAIHTGNGLFEEIRQEKYKDILTGMELDVDNKTKKTYDYNIIVQEHDGWRKHIQLQLTWKEPIKTLSGKREERLKSLSLNTYIVKLN